MKHFILIALLTGSTALFANDLVTTTNSPYLIEEEQEPKNETDVNGKKQGYWLHLGKDDPAKGYPAEGKIAEGPYKDDRKDGKWTKYFKDGMTPKLIGMYSNGRPKGEFTKFFDNGTKKAEGTFIKGKHQGSLKRFYEDGTPAQEKNFNTEGKEEGKQVLYYPNGQVEVEYETSNGVKTGKQIRYYENGDVKQVTTYNPDGTVGEIVDKEPTQPVAVEKVETGGGGPTPGSQGIVKDGEFKPHSYNKVYNTDEELWLDGKFKSGKLWDGKLYKYDSDGILLKIEIWKDGKYHSDGIL